MSVTDFPIVFSAEPDTVFRHFRITTSTSGAIASRGNNRGFGTVTRTGTGTYKLPLDKNFFELLGFNSSVEGATVTSGKGERCRIVSQTLSGATPNVVFECRAADGTVADVTDGHAIFGFLALKASSV